MPIHIDGCNRKRNISLRKFIEQRKVFVGCIRMISRPPVAESITRQHGRRARNFIERVYRNPIIIAISKNVYIFTLSSLGNNFTVFVKRQRAFIMQNSNAAFRAYPVVQNNFSFNSATVNPVFVLRIAVATIQSAVSAAQITVIIQRDFFTV